MAEMTPTEARDLLRRLQSQWSQRNAEYDLARRRYAGEHWDAATNPAFPNRYSITLNYLKPFVDKSVQLLVGRMPAIQVMPSGTDEPARRHAEQLEGILYGTYQENRAAESFYKAAWDSFVLRRGLMYLWWDPKNTKVRFRHCVPDHFYPQYDGDEIWRCIYLSKRPTDRLKAEYPDDADQITPDSAMEFPIPTTSDPSPWTREEQTTIIDVFDADGGWNRIMGDAAIYRDTKYPFKRIPFVEFPCFPTGSGGEPMNLIDQLVELNQYLDVLFSQKADIISKYANPTILDFASGQSPEDIRRAVAAQGAVIPVRRDGNIALLNWTGTVPAIDEQMTFTLDAMFDLAGKPRSAFGQTVTNQSGIVTNLALTPTLQSNEMHETIWGQQLSLFNEMILQLWEEFSSGAQINFRGRKETVTGTQKFYETEMTGSEIGGWYKNRIKWPSAIRTDDPVYVQNHLQQLQGGQFPALSLYTYLEEMGVEDVEAEIDRISEQLMDPRFHPDRMTAAMGALTTLQGSDVPPSDPAAVGMGMPGSGPPLPGAPGLNAPAPVMPQGAAPMASSLVGNPNRDPMMAAASSKGKY